MDLIIGLLIAWSLGKAHRVGMRINGLTDQALDLAVDRVWNVVSAKLGANTAITRLLSEAARTGDVSLETRAEAERVLDDAAAADPMFAEALREAASPAPAPVSAPPPPPPWGPGQFAGVSLGPINSGGGSVDIRNKSKIVNYARQHPVVTVVAVLVMVIAAGLLIGGIVGRGSETSAASTTTTTPGVSRSEPATSGETRRTTNTDASAIAGTWTASDGTGTKTFSTSGGICDGFYYAQGQPLDIGGPMTCVISTKADAQGRHTLVVTQSVNRSSYKIEFADEDHATVFDNSGTRLYELERF